MIVILSCYLLSFHMMISIRGCLTTSIWQDVITEDFFEPSYPNESITFNNGEVTVGIPLTIAEPEINAQTMERNCNRLRLEVGAAMTAVLYYLPNENTNNIF